MRHVLRQALEHDKANDLMFWASSYNLFVSWSVNGQHPWDMLPGAGKLAATLEIGALRGSNNKACMLLCFLLDCPCSTSGVTACCQHACMLHAMGRSDGITAKGP
jgi:hypothetical protein